jgi:hypothetical protein
MSSRSYSDLFKQGLEANYSNQSFFTSNSFDNLSFYGGSTDRRVGGIEEITQHMMNNPTVFGIVKKISDIIYESGYKVFKIQKDGSVAETSSSKEIKNILEENNIEQIIQNFIVAGYGSGLGNGLGYKIRNKGKIEVKFDPFITAGFHRVEVYGENNLNNLEILKYKVLNSSGQTVYEFDKKDVYHYQFANLTGNPAFGSNPVVHAAKHLRLIYCMNMAQDSIFTGGMQASKLFGLDLDAMIKTGVPPRSIQDSQQKLIEDLKQANGLANKNRMVMLSHPIKSYDIQMNNSEMRVPELLPMLDNLIFRAFGVDPAILNNAESKYDNAEKAKDQLYQSVRPFTMAIEKFIETYFLPNLLAGYDTSKFIFRIPRQFSDEEIRIKKEMNDQNASYFANLKTANESLSDINVKVLPTAEKLKYFQEQGMEFKTMGKEEISISPSESNQIADSFTQITNAESVNRQLDQQEIDDVYSKYHATVNMSASELESWSNNECSKNASLDRSPIERNLKLLRTPKSQWGQNEVTQANRTISFVSRMKGAEQGEPTKTNDGKACPSKRDISLKNWAYNPTNNRSVDFWDTVKLRIDKSFKQVLES